MKIQKQIAMIAAAVCAFAVSNARAQVATNFVTLSVTIYQQGPTNTVTHGTNTVSVFGPTSVKTYNTGQFIQEVIGPHTGHTNFTSAAKLAQAGEVWMVIEGTNIVDISGIINITPGDFQIESGTQSQTTFLSDPKISALLISTLQYNDGVVQFAVSGLATASTTDTVPNTAGNYTETGKATIMSMAGEGSNQTGPMIVTAKVSGSSKALLNISGL